MVILIKVAVYVNQSSLSKVISKGNEGTLRLENCASYLESSIAFRTVKGGFKN